MNLADAMPTIRALLRPGSSARAAEPSTTPRPAPTRPAQAPAPARPLPEPRPAPARPDQWASWECGFKGCTLPAVWRLQNGTVQACAVHITQITNDLVRKGQNVDRTSWEAI